MFAVQLLLLFVLSVAQYSLEPFALAVITAVACGIHVGTGSLLSL